MIRILHVEDSELIGTVVKGIVQKVHPSTVIEVVTTLGEAVDRVINERYDVIILDLNLDDSAGPATVRRLRKVDKDTPIIVFSSLDTVEIAMQAAKYGANYYIDKDHTQLLPKAIACAVESRQLKNDLCAARKMYQSVVDVMDDWIFRVTPEGTVLFINRSMLDALSIGHTNYELTQLESIVGSGATRMLCSYATVLSVESPTKYIGEVKLSGRWINLRVLGVFDSNNRIKELQFVGRDVTEDRESIERLIVKSNVKIREFEQKLSDTWKKAAVNMTNSRINLQFANA